jgi:hypothetical protein
MAEDISGIWKGTLSQGPGGCFPHYFLELQIDLSNDQVTGKAYDYYDKTHFVQMSFTGRYNARNHRLVLIEDKILQQNIPEDCAPCTKTYDLSYSKQDGEEMLIGDWKGVMQDRRLSCPPGRIVLRRSTVSDFPEGTVRNDTLVSLQRKLHIQPRETEIVRSITVSSPDIKVELYDNGEIDHDTVTVFINGKLLLYRKMLTDRPLTLEVHAIAGLEYELVMYADNLGEIPPNTALMMVTAGTRKIEVFLTSSEQKNAAVRFVYKPD